MAERVRAGGAARAVLRGSAKRRAWGGTGGGGCNRLVYERPNHEWKFGGHIGPHRPGGCEGGEHIRRRGISSPKRTTSWAPTVVPGSSGMSAESRCLRKRMKWMHVMLFSPARLGQGARASSESCVIATRLVGTHYDGKLRAALRRINQGTAGQLFHHAGSDELRPRALRDGEPAYALR